MPGARVLHEPGWPTDFDQLWHAARALVHGGDPYGVVGPGREFEWLWPLYYPLPAVLLAVPFTALPVAAARVAFSSLGGFALGWSMGTRVRVLWPLALSASYLIALSRSQWSPLILAAAWVPALAFVAVAKPNVGVMAFAAQTRVRDVAVAAGAALLLLALSFLVRPGWLGAWLAAIADAPHVSAPVTRPFGFLLALALLRWRRADARALLVLACVPHTPSLYDLLPLFVLCRSVRESLALAVLTHAAYWGLVVFGSFATFDLYAAGLGKELVFVVYLPALAAVLLRPNEPEAPFDGTTARARGAATLPDDPAGAALLVMLLVGAFFLVWLPLVTYRAAG